MFVEQNFYVGLRDINNLKELKNTSLLSYMVDVACMHSEFAGYGVTTMNETKRTWILLSWKVKVIKRPSFNDTLKVQTWSRYIHKFYAFRDFRIYNQNGELVGIATSKWVFINTDNGRLMKVEDEIASKYKAEPEKNFEEEDFPKINEPDTVISKIDYKVTRNMIDVNNHLDNIYYMDIAKEALPQEINFSNELNEFEIMYKKEVKLDETVKAIYSKEDDYHYVTIKNQDESITHAIIRLK